MRKTMQVQIKSLKHPSGGGNVILVTLTVALLLSVTDQKTGLSISETADFLRFSYAAVLEFTQNLSQEKERIHK